MVCSKIRLLQIVVENDFGGKVAVPLAEQLGYMACYANNNNGPRFEEFVFWRSFKRLI